MNMNFLKDRYKEWSDSYEFDHPGTRCGNELLERADKASSSVTAELFGKIEKKMKRGSWKKSMVLLS